MPLARFKRKDKPYCSNQLSLLLSCWNRGKDTRRLRENWNVDRNYSKQGKYNVCSDMKRTDLSKALKCLNIPLLPEIINKPSSGISICWHWQDDERLCAKLAEKPEEKSAHAAYNKAHKIKPCLSLPKFYDGWLRHSPPLVWQSVLQSDKLTASCC